MLLAFSALAIVFFYTSTIHVKLTPVMQVIANLMLFYLLFSLGRMLILLVFSFAEYFFRRQYKDPDTYPFVSVIVPCFNEDKVIRQAIQSLENLDYPNFEVIIVDDGSTDMTLVEAKAVERKARIRVISQENLGKAGALNRGISEALGEYVFCMDADSVLDPKVLKHGIWYFQQRPKLSAVAGSVHVGNTNNVLTLFQKLEYVIGLNFFKTAQSFLSMVLIVPGPVGMFKKSAVLSVGGYHSDTFAEDTDLTIRMLVAGHEIAYCPDMAAVTEAPEDFQSLIRQRYRWSRGIVQTVAKNSSWLFTPYKSLRNFFILSYLMLESILIPTINFMFTIVTLEHALIYGIESLFGQFLAGLTVLDMTLALYSVFTDRHNVLLVLMAGVNRMTYGLALEVVRFLALFDEAFKLPMNWGKLARKGL